MTTKYEIAASKNGSTVHVCYTARRTKVSLARNMQAFADIVVSVGADETANVAKWSTDEIVLTDGIRIYYTGTTEKDHRK